MDLHGIHRNLHLHFPRFTLSPINSFVTLSLMLCHFCQLHLLMHPSPSILLFTFFPDTQLLPPFPSCNPLLTFFPLCPSSHSPPDPTLFTFSFPSLFLILQLSFLFSFSACSFCVPYICVCVCECVCARVSLCVSVCTHACVGVHGR